MARYFQRARTYYRRRRYGDLYHNRFWKKQLKRINRKKRFQKFYRGYWRR